MSFDALLIHELTIRRYVEPAVADRYGNRELEHDADADVITPGRVEWDAGDEDLTNRDLQRRRAMVFLPAGVTLTGLDRIYFADEDLELKVEGPVRKVYDAIGLHHLELDVYRVDG